MYYTVYKITNKINGKEYIGAHKTSDLNDDYMGSGKHIIRAHKKYGLDNFSKEIIFRAVSSDIMYWVERMLVDEEYVAREDTYNLDLGGKGGWFYTNSTGKNLYGFNGKTPNVKDNFTRGLMTQKLHRKDPEYCKVVFYNISNGLKEYYKTHDNHFKGKKHTESSKKAIGEKSAVHQKGEHNSQYGTRWCHNPLTKENKKLKNFEEIEEGWLFGKYKEPKIKVEKQLEKEEKIKTLTEYYEIYSEVGFKKFVEITGYRFSQENLVSRFKKYVKEFVPQNGKKRGTQ